MGMRLVASVEGMPCLPVTLKHMVVLFMLVCFTSDHVQDFNLLEATHVLSYDNHCSSWQGSACPSQIGHLTLGYC